MYVTRQRKLFEAILGKGPYGVTRNYSVELLIYYQDTNVRRVVVT